MVREDPLWKDARCRVLWNFKLKVKVFFDNCHWSRDKTSPGAGKRFFPDIFLKYISQASSAP